MKDKRLEEQFKEYFKGVEIPELPNNIVADAKKSVKRRERILPRVAKIASVAASFALVFAVAIVILTKTDFSAMPPANGGDETGSSGKPVIRTYDDSALTAPKQENAYALSAVDKKLKFIENFAYAANAEVKSAQTYYFAESGKLAHAKAEVTYISGVRYDAEIYVEFAEDTYSPLVAYSDGISGTYGGLSYRLIKEVAENGEPANKLFVEKDGVKYYFNVQSSDENSYIKCIGLLLQNF